MDQERDLMLEGTGFQPKFKKAIWADIKKCQSKFPDLIVDRYVRKPYTSILIQGGVPMTCTTGVIQLPLNIMLPDEFPMKAPITQIYLPNGVNPVVSVYLDAKGIVDTEKIVPWVPLKTTLPNFVYAIVCLFSKYPPYDPRCAGVVDGYLAQMKNRKSPTSSNPSYNPNSAPGSIPGSAPASNPVGENQKEKFTEEKNKLTKDYREGKITIDLYIEGIRKLHRSFYEDFLYDQCK